MSKEVISQRLDAAIERLPNAGVQKVTRRCRRELATGGEAMNLSPVQKEMCQTCPFRNDANALKEFRTLLTLRALGQDADGSGAPECHSTGGAALEFTGKTGVPVKLCRGARNVSLRFFYIVGFIEAPTDEAWDKKRKELGV